MKLTSRARSVSATSSLANTPLWVPDAHLFSSVPSHLNYHRPASQRRILVSGSRSNDKLLLNVVQRMNCRWHAFAQIPADVAVLRQGKKGHLGSMLLLYLPCRVLSLLSVLFEAVYVVLSPHALGEVSASPVSS